MTYTELYERASPIVAKAGRPGKLDATNAAANSLNAAAKSLVKSSVRFVGVSSRPNQTQFRLGVEPIRSAARVSLERNSQGVARLIGAELVAAGEPYTGKASPRLFLNRRALDALGGDFTNESFNIVAHQIHGAVVSVIVGMNGDLGWRQRKDQPASAVVDEWETEDVPQECPVRFRILRVHEKVRAHYQRSLQP